MKWIDIGLSRRSGFLTVGLMTVDEDPNETISVPDTLDILNVTVHSISERRISIPIEIETDHNTEKTHALVDCGAEGLFIDKSIAHKWKRQPINPIKVRNVDGMLNIEGEIDKKCLITFDMNGRTMTEWFLVSALGSRKMILGLPWLEKHNPIVNWKEKTLEFCDSDEKDKTEIPLRSTCQINSVTVSEREEDLVIRYLQSHKGLSRTDHEWKVNPFEDIGSWSEDTFDHLTIAQYTPAQQMEHKYHQTEEVDVLPPEYTAYKEVFEKKASERFPESRSWDHKIELREEFKPKKGKIYPLSPKQQKVLDEWLADQLV